jgi:beta-lactam-binding protein with PASTA domain
MATPPEPPPDYVAEEEVTRPAGPPPPERNWWVWLVVLLVLVVGGLLAWYFLSRGSDKSKVPDVIGLPEQVAAQRVHQKGLIAIPNTGPSSRSVGVVFAQRPGPGVQVDKGQTVTIFISSGPARKAIPNVTDLPLEQAQQRLTAAGFKSRVKRVASKRPKGVVTEQTPVAGVTAVKGTTVVLTVSNGRQPVIVPSVVGQTQGAAVSQLTKLGLKPQLQNVPSNKPVGLVVAQKPAAGQEVNKGSTVILNVSRGTGGGTTTPQTTTTTATTATTVTTTTAAAPVRIPTVRGLAIAAGLRRLNTTGLRPVVRYVSSTQPAGRIVRRLRLQGPRAPAHASASMSPRVRIRPRRSRSPTSSARTRPPPHRRFARPASRSSSSSGRPPTRRRTAPWSTSSRSRARAFPAARTWRSSSGASPDKGDGAIRAAVSGSRRPPGEIDPRLTRNLRAS